jgi:pimeloyl-ACP methyl ester carboxylesterase
MARLSAVSLFRMLAAVAAIAFAAPGARVHAASGPSIAALRVAGAREVKSVFVRAPGQVSTDQPLQVLVALHGMGGNGADFGGALAAQAEAHGWLIVAPTIVYGDWTDPNQIAREDPALVEWLSELVTHLSERTGYTVQPRVLLFGHSRGAQLALRFTEVHPDQVLAVAAASAGTYTLPVPADVSTGEVLPYPFGIADLAQRDGGQSFDVTDFSAVPIWIGVGGADTADADVPDAWDPYIGADRLARAQRFTQALQVLGANVALTVFPNTDHTLTDEIRAAGCTALAASAESANAPTV